MNIAAQDIGESGWKILANKSLLLTDRVFDGVRLRYPAPDLIRFAP